MLDEQGAEKEQEALMEAVNEGRVRDIRVLDALVRLALKDDTPELRPVRKPPLVSFSSLHLSLLPLHGIMASTGPPMTSVVAMRPPFPPLRPFAISTMPSTSTR